MARVLIIGLRAITTGSGEQIAKCRSSILRQMHDLYKEILGIQQTVVTCVCFISHYGKCSTNDIREICV